MGEMGWRTEDAGVSQLVERYFGAHGVRMGNQTGGGNHVSVWDALVFGFFEQKMGRACLKFGESTNFALS